MSDHGEKIWQQGSASEILKEARLRYGGRPNSASSFVGLASTHYSLVKRYKGVRAPLALWHAWRAAVHARKAVRIRLGEFDQVDVVSTILAKVPWWLGGNRALAKQLIISALEYGCRSEPVDEVLPHTRALLLVTLAGIYQHEGKAGEARDQFLEALALEREVYSELDMVMAERQWVRVVSAAGFYFYDQAAEGIMRSYGVNLILTSWTLAERVSKDQAEKIYSECRKRNIELSR